MALNLESVLRVHPGVRTQVGRNFLAVLVGSPSTRILDLVVCTHYELHDLSTERTNLDLNLGTLPRPGGPGGRVSASGASLASIWLVARI